MGEWKPSIVQQIRADRWVVRATQLQYAVRGVRGRANRRNPLEAAVAGVCSALEKKYVSRHVAPFGDALGGETALGLRARAAAAS